MTTFCTACNKEHEDVGWRFTSYTIEQDGQEIKKSGWFCETSSGRKVSYPEFVPNRIKEDRKKYAKDLIQPFRDGVMSQEFIDAYPQQAKKYPKDLVSKAKNVWK
jgi:hypothetical protein